MIPRDFGRRLSGRLGHYRVRLRQRARRSAYSIERVLHRRSGYRYDAEEHKTYLDPDRLLFVPRASTFGVDHLLHPGITPTSRPISDAPAQIFTAWTGDAPMSATRQRSLSQLREVADGIAVHVVTPRTLTDFVLADHPLHRSYDHLSLVHRSDYLRAYLLHHHGGLYMDIKPVTGEPRTLLDRLASRDDLWAVGAPEIGPDNLASNPFGPLGREERVHYEQILQQGLLACRPRTPFVAEWLREVERRMNYFADLLGEYPATTPRGLGETYPVPWHSLLAEVLAPLCLKHGEHIETLPGISYDLSRDYY